MPDPITIRCPLPWHRTRTKPRRWQSRGGYRWFCLVGPLRLWFDTLPWKGTYLSQVAYLGAREDIPRVLRTYPWETAMKKPSPKPAAERPPHLAAVETNVLADLMPLVEHCAATRWDDGSARVPGWLQIRTMGTDWFIIAKEPDLGLMLQIRNPSLDDCLFALAALLGAEDCPWQEDPFATGPKQKGKKRP